MVERLLFSCGLYHASAGTYKLYGMDINEWNIESARENMALVSQDTFLFPGTIEENIRYGNINATHDEVVNACKDARIHDFIEGLTDGYETVIHLLLMREQSSLYRMLLTGYAKEKQA